MLRNKTWRYLRYLHFRDAVKRVAKEIEHVCVCGAGHGYAELAVAAEFPHITFTLTDTMNSRLGYPNYHYTMDMAWKWGVENLRFSIWNVLESTHRRFDLVASTEMLEHIQDARNAADNMRAAATKYVYCLVPYADKATNANPDRRRYAWEKHEHFVYGFDAETLSSLFPNAVMLAGTYWKDRGRTLRELLDKLNDEEIRARVRELQKLAETDLVNAIPTSLKDALGIKILSRTGA